MPSSLKYTFIPSFATTAAGRPLLSAELRRSSLLPPIHYSKSLRFRASRQRNSTTPNPMLRRHTTTSSKESEPATSPETSGDSKDEKSDEYGPLENANLRIFLGLISLMGSFETLYLTFNKLFSSPGAICATQGCLDVLTGPFSTFFGIPLSLIGFLSYSIFSYLSFYPLLASEPQMKINRDKASKPLLVFLSTGQFTFTLYLLFLLKYIIKSFCPYCVFSAALSIVLFLSTTVSGKFISSLKSKLSISSVAFIATCLIASLSLTFSWPQHLSAQALAQNPQAPPEISAPSDQDSLRIATKLATKDTKMYGAFWCTHCYDQKQRFGKKAFGMLKYVECDKNGKNSQAQLCRDKRIPGYPTWEINGELFPGEIELSELERLVDEASKP